MLSSLCCLCCKFVYMEVSTQQVKILPSPTDFTQVTQIATIIFAVRMRQCCQMYRTKVMNSLNPVIVFVELWELLIQYKLCYRQLQCTLFYFEKNHSVILLLYCRDHPSTIKKRFLSVFIMMFISPLFLYYFSQEHVLQKVSVTI